MITEKKKLSFAKLLTWIDAAPSRKGHHDIELLKYLAGKAGVECWLLPPSPYSSGDYTALELILSKEPDDFAYWNEWDSFSGWACVSDVLWADLQPFIGERVAVSKPAKPAKKPATGRTK
jgi:hypothetical protein